MSRPIQKKAPPTPDCAKNYAQSEFFQYPESSMIKLVNSPVSSFKYATRQFYVKRDDLLDSRFNGNKARKLAYFIHTPFPQINTLISFGGNQSNLMYSLACLAKLRHWKFIYYTQRISAQALANEEGNLTHSLAHGMQLIELNSNYKEVCANLTHTAQPTELIISQGAAQLEAEYGLRELANEIRVWARHMQFAKIAIFMPSGTGISAYLLQKNLAEHIVYTTNCVGNVDYLKQQIHNIAHDQKANLPLIFANQTYKFAQPHQQLWVTIQQIQKASQIEFDLVYDPVGWQILLQNLAQITLPILYIHGGGVLGNSTMLKRYQQRTHAA